MTPGTDSGPEAYRGRYLQFLTSHFGTNLDRSHKDVAKSSSSYLLVGGLGRRTTEVQLVTARARHLLHAGLLALVARVPGRATVPTRQLGRRVQHGHEAGVGRGSRVGWWRFAVGEGRRRVAVGWRGLRVVGEGARVLQEGPRRRRGRRGGELAEQLRGRAGRRRGRAGAAVGRRARGTVRARQPPHAVQLLQRSVLLLMNAAQFT